MAVASADAVAVWLDSAVRSSSTLPVIPLADLVAVALAVAECVSSALCFASEVAVAVWSATALTVQHASPDIL